MTEPHYQDGSVRLFGGDCLDVLPDLPDNSVDAVVTDPPYGIEFMGKAWDSFSADAVSSSWDTRGRTMTASPERDPATPGGRSAAKTHIRDNPRCRKCSRTINGADTAKGFKVCHCTDPDIYAPSTSARKFQAWCEQWAAECLRILKPGGHLLAFGGTRTSHRLACGIEDAGFEIRDGKVWLYGSGFPKSLNVGRAIDGMFCREAGTHTDDPEHVCPPTPQGDEWRGHGTALKPAHEPIVVARKPLVGTVAANVLRYGTGALNIDAGRIGAGETVPGGGSPTAKGSMYSREMQARHGYRPDGEPFHAQSNQADPHTNGRWPANVVLDESQAAALDQMSGETAPKPEKIGRRGGTNANPMSWEEGNGDLEGRWPADPGGGASRFFYTAKASTDERITHNGIAHATVKPLSLMRWLVRLATPPGGVILEPFAGSGTTVEAAILEGFRCIAIEREADYLPLITQRINRRRDPIAYIRQAGDDLGLFAEDAL